MRSRSKWYFSGYSRSRATHVCCACARLIGLGERYYNHNRQYRWCSDCPPVLTRAGGGVVYAGRHKRHQIEEWQGAGSPRPVPTTVRHHKGKIVVGDRWSTAAQIDATAVGVEFPELEPIYVPR